MNSTYTSNIICVQVITGVTPAGYSCTYISIVVTLLCTIRLKVGYSSLTKVSLDLDTSAAMAPLFVSVREPRERVLEPI